MAEFGKAKSHIFRREIFSLFFIGCILGGIIFVGIFGIKILNFTNVDWIYAQSGTIDAKGSDIVLTQIAFDLFRNAPWTFPIGVFSNYGYPYETSIIFTDPISVFAVLFKFLNNLLPLNFQYIGLWTLLSYMLQGGLTCIILRKYINNWLYILLSTPIFVCSTIMLIRTFAHVSLSAHWIVLLGIAAYVYRGKFKKTSHVCIFWAVLCAFSAVTHIYFLVMNGFIMLAFIVSDYVEFGNFKKGGIVLVTSVISTVVLFYSFGGFVMGLNISDSGLGMASANLNSFFNPFGKSNIIPYLPVITGLQWEGIQYLGAGILILLMGLVIYGFYLLIMKDQRIIKRIKNAKILPPMIFGLILFIITLSPIITFNDRVLFSYIDFPLIYKLLSPIRSTGRVGWPITYSIIFLCIVGLWKINKNKKVAIICLFVLLSVQLYDTSGFLSQLSATYRADSVYTAGLKGEFWNEIASRVKHLENVTESDAGYERLSVYAAKSNLTLSNAYIVRKDPRINERAKQQIALVSAGILDEDSVYVVPVKEAQKGAFYTEEHKDVYKVDDLYVILKKGILNEQKFKNLLYTKDMYWNNAITPNVDFSACTPTEIKYGINTAFTTSDKAVYIEGWTFVPEQQTNNQQVFVEITDKTGKQEIYCANETERGDVAEYFINPFYKNSGFQATVLLEGCDLESAQMRIIIKNEKGLYKAANPIEYDLGAAISGLPLENFPEAELATDIHCSIDQNNIIDGHFTLVGWVYRDNIDTKDQKVYIELINSNGERKVFKATQKDRKDVSEAFKNTLYFNSGYSMNIPTKNLGTGEYEIRIMVGTDNNLMRTDGVKKIKIS